VDKSAGARTAGAPRGCGGRAIATVPGTRPGTVELRTPKHKKGAGRRRFKRDDHLRMQSTVAAVPDVAHFGPSVAPVAQTNETRSSLSSQRTLSVPVTTRIGGAGRGPPLGRVVRLGRAPLRGLAVQLRHVSRQGLPAPVHRPRPADLADRPDPAGRAGQLRRARRRRPGGQRVLAGLGVSR
jgi:hypothetical protein